MKIENVLDGQFELLCPNCNDCYLHQFKTLIFERDEDHNDGIYVDVTRNDVKISKNIIDFEYCNPSSRRSGLSIFFFCENCGMESKLDVYQHKGISYMQHDTTGKTFTEEELKDLPTF